MSVYHIRKRTRRGYVREAQGYTSWDEWQVVDGRKVVGRFDHQHQAEEFAGVKYVNPEAEVIIFPGIPKVRP